MALAFDTTFQKGRATGGASPFAFVSNAGDVTGTVGSTAGRVLIGFVSMNASVAEAGTVTMSWAGNALSSIGTYDLDIGGGNRAQLFAFGLKTDALVTTGNQSLSVAWTGAYGGANISLGAIAVNGADSVTGWQNFGTANGGASPATITVTSASGNLAIGCLHAYNGAVPSITAGTSAWVEGDLDGNTAQGYRASSSGSTTITYTTGTVPWGMLGVDVIASGGAAPAPFVSSIGAQMIPVGKPNYQAMLCGFVLGTALTLSQGAQQMPVGKSVAFVPAQTRSASMTTLTHLQARPPYYQDIQPFNQTHWPLPRLPGTLLSVTINIRPPLDTPAAVVLPFSQTDWPLPQGKPYPIVLRTWTQDRKQYYTDIQPFNQTHWPPGRAMPPAPGLTTATSAAQQGVLSLPIGGIPTGAQMLALPLYKPAPSPTLLTWVQIPPPIATQSLGGLPPQINYDWPLPPRAAVPPPTRLTHVSYYVYNTNLPSIPGTTFPLPYGKPYPIALRTWIHGTPRYYTDTVPFNQTEWPVPQARPRLAGLTTWTQSLVLNTLSIVPGTPIVPALWPMPFSRRLMPPTWTQTPPNLATSTLGAPGWALLLGGERNRLVREMT